MKLANKVTLVTGASRGIGREIAKVLAMNGAKVGLVARSVENLSRTKEMIDETGGEASIFPTDLRDSNAIEKLYFDVKSLYGGVDILVNNAAVWHDDSRMYYGPLLHEIPLEELEEVINVGILAPMQLTRLIIPGMVKKRVGKILQISGGFSGVRDAIGWLHAYVSKKGIENFTQGLAEELREFEIQVNCISPWYVNTEPVQKFLSEEIDEALDPKDVGKLALYLVSSESDNLTGQVILIRNKQDHG